MKRWLALLPLLLLLSLCVGMAQTFEYTPEEIARSEEGVEKWREFARTVEEEPGPEELERLGLGLLQTSRASSYPFGEREAAHAEVREAMMRTSGYGELYSSRLNDAWEKIQQAPNLIEAAPRYSDLDNLQIRIFPTLALLPTPEAVRTLGEFLYDERGLLPLLPSESAVDRQRRQNRTGMTSNSVMALQAIAQLPLVSPPVPRRLMNGVIYEEDIDAWRLWYEQVKAGKRSFRFEGDPREYNLDGPLTAKAVASKGANPGAGGEAKPSEEAAGTRWWLLAGVLVILGIAAWRVSVARRTVGR